jgi:tetratricopeptide (TPR) repeat protein
VQVIARDREDLDARWDRAVLYAEVDEPKKALKEFESINSARQGDTEVKNLRCQADLVSEQLVQWISLLSSCCDAQAAKMLARLYHRLGMGQKAIDILETQVRDFPGATDLTHVNILAELYMDDAKYEQAAALISHADQLPCAQEGLPIDLTVNEFLKCTAVGTSEFCEMKAIAKHFIVASSVHLFWGNTLVLALTLQKTVLLVPLEPDGHAHRGGAGQVRHLCSLSG